jgi:hypothetical protein
MNTDAIKPILERERFSSSEDARPTSAWPGWGRRRIMMSYYFGGQFFASLLFALGLRLAHPLYTDVHYQFVAMQSISALIAVLWFVPAMVNDFGKAVGGAGMKTAAGGLSSAVWSLARNIVYMGLFAGGASIPFVFLYNSSEVVGRQYYTDSFQLTWGFHVLIASILLAAFTVSASSVGVALLLTFRSLVTYRITITAVIGASLMHPWLVFNLLAGSGIVMGYKKFQDLYWALGRLNYPGYFTGLIHDVDGGNFFLNHIPSLTGKIIVALLMRFIGSGVLLMAFLWLGAGISSGLSILIRNRQQSGPRRLAAKPALAIVTAIACLGLAAAMLLHNTSYLMVTSYRTGAQGTPFDLILLGVIVVIAYIIISTSLDALQCTGQSGLGDSLPTVMWRFQRGGIGLVLAAIFAGSAYLALFAKMSGYSFITLIAGVGLLLLAAAVMMTVAAGAVVISRLTHGFWGVPQSLQGFVITLLAGFGTFFLFTRFAPDTLVTTEGGDPAQMASLYADEIARLAASSYPALIHSWLHAFEAGASSATGLVQLSFAVLAAVAAVALALSLISRLSRRLA